MPAELVPAVEAGGVGSQEPFHAGHEVAPGRLDHQMKVIGHEAERMHLPAGLPAGFSQRVEEQHAIPLRPENGFAPVAAIHDVINRARIFQSQPSGHAPCDPTVEAFRQRNMCLCGTDTFLFLLFHGAVEATRVCRIDVSKAERTISR